MPLPLHAVPAARAGLLVIACAVLTGCGRHAGASRPPPLPPARVDLAGPWRYLPYDGESNLAAPDLDDAAWPVMHLPSSWFLRGRSSYPRGASADATSTVPTDPGALVPIDDDRGLDYAGTVWFRRSFEWP